MGWRKDNKEHGVGRGGYSTNNGGHTYDEDNLTERMQLVIQAYLEHDRSPKQAAYALGLTKGDIMDTLHDIGERLGIEDGYVDDIVAKYQDLHDTGEADDSASDNTSDEEQDIW